MEIKERKSFLPDKIILETLEGEPAKFEVPVLGGIDTDWITVLQFTLKSERLASAVLAFDDDIRSLRYISFGFYGMHKYIPEDFIAEFNEKSNKQELSILKQASKILNGRTKYKKFRKAIEERITFITKTKHLKNY